MFRWFCWFVCGGAGGLVLEAGAGRLTRAPCGQLGDAERGDLLQDDVSGVHGAFSLDRPESRLDARSTISTAPSSIF